MTYGTLPGGYPPISKLLHWLVALCVIVTVPIGISLPFTSPGPTQDSLYNFHKSLGLLILILMLLRLANRIVVGAPAPEPTIADWQRRASSAVHGALYALLIVQPILGYWANATFGAVQPFFGLFEIRPIVRQNLDLADQLFFVHRWIGLLIAALVVLHIAAALRHYFIQKDGVLQRMLPRALGGA